MHRAQTGVHLRIFRAERIMIDTAWNIPNVQSPFWRLYANKQDGASLLLDSGEFLLRAGEVYLVPAMVPFSCKNVRSVEHFYIHFDVIGLSLLALSEQWNRPMVVPRAPLLMDTVREIVNDMPLVEWPPLNQPPIDGFTFYQECRLKSVIYTALASAMDAMPADVREQGERCARQIEPVLPAVDYIHTHLGGDLSVPVLALQCQLSPDTFARRFRECAGQTPTQYVLEQRITNAAQRLLFSRDSIDRIAETTGFGNRFYFSRLFARRFGLSPAAFRRAGQAGI